MPRIGQVPCHGGEIIAIAQFDSVADVLARLGPDSQRNPCCSETEPHMKPIPEDVSAPNRSVRASGNQ